VDSVVVFGTQYFVQKYLIEDWNVNFFWRYIEDVLEEYHRVIDNHLGPNVIDDDKIRYLHSLGHLPLKIKALPEGTLCPIGVPLMTIINTDPKCGWLTNFIETISQTVMWLPITSATTAYYFRKLLDGWVDKTSDKKEMVPWMGHDFSMRGMSSFESCYVSGGAHALSFTGSDVIPAIPFLEHYYGADVTQEMIVASVTASEHSIQCSYFDDGEDESRYIQAMLDAQPEGIVSIVADGYDYWKMISETLPKFKEKILSRNGKTVIRPDSGSPFRIICGYNVTQTKYTYDELIEKLNHQTSYIKLWQDVECYKTSDGRFLTEHEEITELEAMGSVRILHSVFGGFLNSKGYIELDEHIGLIYGDSITYALADKICKRLCGMGYSVTSLVFGIGSYTYSYVTRDTFGLACKATWIQVGGKSKSIFKSPKTGDGMKKSAKGLLSVQNIDGKITLLQDCTPEEEDSGMLETVFYNGMVYNTTSLSKIRTKLHDS
jgi:nicotinamide phosphoribosyltransferase